MSKLKRAVNVEGNEARRMKEAAETEEQKLQRNPTNKLRMRECKVGKGEGSWEGGLPRIRKGSKMENQRMVELRL